MNNPGFGSAFAPVLPPLPVLPPPLPVLPPPLLVLPPPLLVPPVPPLLVPPVPPLLVLPPLPPRGVGGALSVLIELEEAEKRPSPYFRMHPLRPEPSTIPSTRLTLSWST